MNTAPDLPVTAPTTVGLTETTAAARIATATSSPSRWRLTPLGWIVAGETVVLWSTLAWQPRPLGAVIGAALTIAFVYAWKQGRKRTRALTLMVLHPNHTIAGEPTTVTMRATSHPAGSGFIIDTPTGVRGGRETIAKIGDIDDQGLRFTWELLWNKRGWQPLPPVDVCTQQPFGLCTHRRTVQLNHELLILPGRGILKRDLRRRLDPWIEQIATGMNPGDEEVARLRPYQPGDPPRRVHWRASARMRQLMVAERHAPTARHMALVIDTDSDALSPRRLDRLAAIAASFVDHLLRREWQVTIHGRFAPSGCSGDRNALLELLALIQAEPADMPLEHCIPYGRAAIVITPRELTVATTQFPQPLILSLDTCEELVRLPKRLGV